MRSNWVKASVLALLALPVAAIGDTSPQVTLAIPGSAGTNSGAIQRFTMRFSETMVALGDPRATAPAAMKCPVASTGRWVDPQTYVFDYERVLRERRWSHRRA